ncbi:MAG TPA: LTA synthase family protein [Sediminibacterium sp.]|nr:LTA synthase family protein [Sediminibacterium sp.]
MNKKPSFISGYLKAAVSLLVTIWLLRVFAYLAIAAKSFTPRAGLYETIGLVYDLIAWLIWCGLLLLPSWILYKVSTRAFGIFFHSMNCLLLVCLLGLLITFSERNNPFDHELFTRNSRDTIDTIKQMLGAGIKPYLPFLIYLPLYAWLNWLFGKRDLFPLRWQKISVIVFPLSVLLMPVANPQEAWFKTAGGYHLTVNVMSYWAQDSYHFLFDKKRFPQGLEAAIRIYQQEHPFQFTNPMYPLLHRNNDPDVLGDFFNLGQQAPNIVLLVVEGLSRDFSGEHAYATSFTPFLDSLSQYSLVWNNFLSTAPGTFAAHPALSGSLPYGKRGFAVLNIMPAHLSLIQLLRQNGYYTRFLVGFNPDFDNMGGYIRQQGTDFILSHYPSQYREMGIGKEGWSMGYPDDALYRRSFEVMDSVQRFPYLNIYHTGTTHLPYLFDQKKIYDRKFDRKLDTLHVNADIRRTLQSTKDVLVTFMFSDDCIRNFFQQYARRPEYRNTIFIITGDHHIGSFPSLGEIDDYHVPLIIYSPMLKHPDKFLAVNSHNNLTPTLLAMLKKKYPLKIPDQSAWLGGSMDTCRGFRNQQSMAFMSWSREITDYLYKGFFLSGDQLYRLNPDLTQDKIQNDSLRDQIIRLRESFRQVNEYVCDSARIYPAKEPILPGKPELIREETLPPGRKINTRLSDTSLLPFVQVPKGFRYLYVTFSARVRTTEKDEEKYPTLRFGLIDTSNRQKNFLYWSKRDLVSLTKQDFVPAAWNRIVATDLFTLADYAKIRQLCFEQALFGGDAGVHLEIDSLQVRLYGIR